MKSEKITQHKDILFCMSSGSKHLVGKNIVLNNLKNYSFGAFCSVLRCNNKEIVDFIKYFFQSDLFKQEIKSYSKGVNIQNLKGSQLGNIKIPLPPLPEQRRIVSKLDGLFAEIDASLALIDQNIEQAEALKLSVLDEEFGVKGKSWSNLTKVGKVLSAISTGTTPSKKIKDYYNSDDIEWFKPADFDDKRKYLKESRDNLSNKSIKDKKARIFKKDTLLLVAIGATIGKIGLVYKETGSANQQITGMNFKSKIFPEFSYYWFKYIKSTIVRNASSATLPILNQKGIKDLPFNYPDNIDDQQKIVQRLDALFEEIDGLVSDYQEKREDFEALKSSLLDRAFKGEL